MRPASRNSAPDAHGQVAVRNLVARDCIGNFPIEYCDEQVNPPQSHSSRPRYTARCAAAPDRLPTRGLGDPYLACKYLTADVVMSALPGPYEALLCRVIR